MTVIAYHKNLRAFMEKYIVKSNAYMVFTVSLDCGKNVVLSAPLVAMGHELQEEI
jgi:hypothetical protein